MKKTKKFRYIIFTSILSIITAITLIAVFAWNKNDKESGDSSKNYASIQQTSLVYSVFTDTTNKYSGLGSDNKYAALIGIDTSTFSVGTSLWELDIPESYTDATGTYPVKEIVPTISSATTNRMPEWSVVGGTSSAHTFTRSIAKITVPKSVEYIVMGAFNGFEKVEEVVLPFIGTSRGGDITTAESASFLSIFGDSSFRPMSTYEFNTSNGVVSPTGGTGLVNWYNSYTNSSGTTTTLGAQYNCPVLLKKATITDETKINNHAFWWNALLEEIDISFQSGVTNVASAISIGERAFSNCYALTSVVLPDEVSSIGAGIFSQCHELKQVRLQSQDPSFYGATLPLFGGTSELATTIPNDTFYQCSKLEAIGIPHNVKVIGAHAFDECTSVSKIYSTSTTSTATDPGTANLPVGLEKICRSAFRNCASLNKIIVSSNVQEIETMAFNGCTALSDLTVPFIGSKRANSGDETSLFGYIFGTYGDAEDKVLNSSICVFQDADGDETNHDNQGYFYIPSKLERVSITDETIVGPGSFMNCSVLLSIEILSTQEIGTTDTVTQIAKGALRGCARLESLSIPFVGQNDSISGGQLGWIFGTDSYTNAIAVEQGEIFNNNTVYYFPFTLKTVALTHQTTLTSHSFYKVNMITDLVVGNATQRTERSVFTGVTQLTRLTLPFVGIYRGNYSESHWYSYDQHMRNSLVWLFSYINAPEVYTNYSITDWRPNTWASYIPEALKEITITNDTYISTWAFRGMKSLTKIEIVDDNNNDITGIEQACMYNCGSLETLIVPYIGKNINGNAINSYEYCLGWFFGGSAYTNSYNAYQCGKTFYIPKNLTSVSFGSEMKSLSSGAFQNCKSIESVSSESIISQLGSYAFANCTKLSIIDLKKANYTKVGDYAFLNDRAAGEINNMVPATVTRIGNGSFMGTDISVIDFKKYSSIGDYAFANCVQLTTADFTGASLDYVGSYMFSGCKFLNDVTLVKYISPYMFQDCVSLSQIDLDTLASNLEDHIIPAGVFDGCTALTTAGLKLNYLSSGIVYFGANAFRGCTALTEFILPETLQGIGEGAFQNCTQLTHLRIPRSVSSMTFGTDKNGYDDYTSGIFYGCDRDSFYLEVYYSESEWPSGWGRNWNCYYPVYIIGDETENIFTYESHGEYQGYLITGLNIYDPVTNPKGFEFFYTDNLGQQKPVLTGVLKFPATHDGLVVYGLEDGALTNFQAQLAEITDIVLGDYFMHLGEDSLSFYQDHSNPNSGYRTMNIFSNQSYLTKVSTVHYNDELYYSEQAIVYYKEAWKYVGTIPTIRTDALCVSLNSDKLSYNYGVAIKPQIYAITANPDLIKYTDQAIIYENGKDNLLNITHGGPLNYPDIYNLDSLDGTSNLPDLSLYNIQYKNNINVGVGSIILNSTDSRLTGSLTVYFNILQVEIDLFFESDYSEELFGSMRTAGEWIISAVGGLTTPADYSKYVTEYIYSGEEWSWSDWATTALNLKDGFKMSGVLTTTSPNAGYYTSQKGGNGNEEIPLDDPSGVAIQSAGSFKWKERFRIINDTTKEDVTRNFKCAITKCVRIVPYEIDQLDWPGEPDATGVYEYEYTGVPIVPIPNVINRTSFEIMKPNFTVEVTPGDAIDIGSTIYRATITNWDTRNFTFAVNCPKYIDFKIVKAKVTIDFDAGKYVIGENDPYFSFSDWGNATAYPNYKLSISGLGPNSVLTGTIRTSDWKDGIYSSANATGNTFGWDMSGYNITSSSRVASDNVTPLDETGYYDITLNLRVEIILRTFDYEIVMVDSSGVITTLENTIGIDWTRTNENDIYYGADGFAHTLQLQVNNTTAYAAKFTYNGSTNTVFTFTDINNYALKIELTKDRYYPIDRNVTLHVEKGNYEFYDLTKEYDREVIDPIESLKRLPKDFDRALMTFEYYDLNTNTRLSSAPYKIGSYKVIINTIGENHNAWFNDISNLEIEFQITKRSIYIDVVDTILPYDSKEYDGETWKYIVTNETASNLNLLSGDSLTGSFISRSADIGIYDSANSADFVANQSWTVSNSTIGPQTTNYKIVFRGVYEITPRKIQYTSGGGTYTYDGTYHSIDVNVTIPTSGYTVYYNLEQIEADTDSESVQWSIFPYYFNEPGTYTVYFKIVAPTYKTEYMSETIVINGKPFDLIAPNPQTFYYDGFPHSVQVTVNEPRNALIAYSETTNLSNVTAPEELVYSSYCPTHTEIGTYTYFIRISAPNYETVYRSITMVIEDTGPSLGVSLTPENVTYDKEHHGFTLSGIPSNLNLGDLYIYYTSDMTSSNPAWNEIFLTDNNDGTYSYLPFIDAANYNYRIKILCKNYRITEVPLTTVIAPLSLGITSADFLGFTGNFDGEYHTVTIDCNSTNGITSSGGINGDDSMLKYYVTTTLGTETITVPLTVKYNANNVPIESSSWSINPVKYKNVGDYVVYIIVEAPNFGTVYGHGTIRIGFNANPGVDCDDNFQLEYQARPMYDSEVPLTTIHDGSRTYMYQAYSADGTTLINRYISNPMDLGKYRVTVVFNQSQNCGQITMVKDFEIVPKKLEIVYEDTHEYTGEAIFPTVTAVTGTTDVILLNQVYGGPVDTTLGMPDPIEVGDYYIYISMAFANPNYRIDYADQTLIYHIVKRTVKVVVNEEYDYDGATVWTKSTGWNPTNMLDGDIFVATMATVDPYAGTYVLNGTYEYDPASGSYLTSYVNPNFFAVVPSFLEIYKSDGITVAKNYKIQFEISVEIKYPDLSVELVNDLYTYDGNYHSLEFEIQSAGVIGLISSFWIVGNKDATLTNTALQQREAGVYEIGYKFEASNFSAIEGTATLRINKATLIVSIDPFTGMYDGANHDVTFTIDNPGFNLLPSLKPKVYYYNVELLEEKGYTITDLEKWYNKGCPYESPIYNLWRAAPSTLSTAGTYYAFLCFEETNNWERAVAYREVTLDKRPLYFDYLGASPLHFVKDYDGQKYVISMGNFMYDTSVGSSNNLASAGLVNPQFIPNSYGSYFMRTSSADARGEAGNGDPYQGDGDFEFEFIQITTTGSNNFMENYYPVINQKDGVYQVQVIIRRIALDIFDVYDDVVQYNGKDVLPRIETPSDGELVYRYIKTDEYGNRIGSTLLENQRDVGYYEVFVTILTGTNYYGWDGGYDGTDYVSDILLTPLGYKFKKAYVQVVPADVEVQWTATEGVYDGTDQAPTAYITDVYGTQRNLSYQIYDIDSNLMSTHSLIYAGVYNLKGFIPGSTGLNSANYNFTNLDQTFTMFKRAYTLTEHTNEPYLYTNWIKSYTEDDFIDSEDPTWLTGYTLELTLRTKNNMAGMFISAAQFETTNFIVKDANGYDVTDSFQIDLNMRVILESKSIVATSEFVDVEYNNQDISPKISVISHMNGYEMAYASVELIWNHVTDTAQLPNSFDVNKIEYKPGANNVPPSFRNVGWYRVYYRVSIPGDSDGQPYYGSCEVRISQRQSNLTIPSYDKTYDGSAVEVIRNNLNGDYNGYNSDLVFTWYAGDYTGSTSNALASAPYKVGEYTLLVTSAADDTTDPNAYQNYSPLLASRKVTITRATLNIVVNEEWVITNAILANSSTNKWEQELTLTNNGTPASSTYCTGLWGSDVLHFKITSQALQRTTYSFTNGTPETNNFAFNAASSDATLAPGAFNIDWNLYYPNGANDDMTGNYELKLVFNLRVRYQYMSVTVTDYTYSYDPGVTRSPLGTNIVITAPLAPLYTIMYGSVKGEYNQTTWAESLPGIYNIYFIITAPDYEPFEKQTRITIQYETRDDFLTVSDISKAYDDIVYDGLTTGVPTIAWNPSYSISESLPAPSSWTVSYFLADNNNGTTPWGIVGDPLSTVVDAEDYMVRVVIPAGTIFGQTVITKYFKISRIKFTISGTIPTQSYNGTALSYDLTTGGSSVTVSGLLPGHNLKKGTLITNNITVGNYQPNSATNQLIRFTEDGFTIEDSNGRLISTNYEVDLNVTATITLGVIELTDDIPASGKYTYTGLDIIPLVSVITPSGVKCEYSKDGTVWQTDPFAYKDVGNYTFYVRVLNVPNYAPITSQTYHFEIEKSSNKLEIEDLSKEYDGNYVSDPIIKTNDYHGVAPDASTQVLFIDKATGSVFVYPDKPVNVGEYTVQVTYAANSSYNSAIEQRDFSITPATITATWGQSKLEYNALGQKPTLSFACDGNTSWALNSILKEGIHYRVTYYLQTDTSYSHPLTTLPVNVGDYTAILEFIGQSSSNFIFQGAAATSIAHYSIIPCNVTIGYHGQMAYNSGNPMTLTLTDLVVTGLPSRVTLASSIKTKSGAAGSHQASGLYTSTSFTDNFEWLPANSDPILNFTDTGGSDVMSNYNINVDLNLVITTSSIPYSVAKYDDVYDGSPHTFTFNMPIDPNDNISIEYSSDSGSTWSPNVPYLVNATNGPKHYYVKVVSQIYGTQVFGKPTDSDYNEFTINITKQTSTLNTEGIDLNKIYDGQLVVNPTVTYNGDLRDDFLQYKYYVLNATSATANTYTEIDVNDILGIGDYKLVIELKESPNYTGVVAADILFKITEREILITYLNQSKVYDAYQWKALVTNDTSNTARSGAVISGIPGISESGLVPGDIFLGTIQSIYATTGFYKLDPDDFVWESQYYITSAIGADVKKNYKVNLNLEVTISGATFDVTGHDGGGAYDGITEYFIKVEWNSNPLVAGVIDLEDLIWYKDSPNGTWQQQPIGKLSGTTTIYWKIEAPNYLTYESSNVIRVAPINTTITVDDYPGKVDDIIYNGLQYDVSQIQYSINIGSNRIPTFKFYTSNNEALADAPTNVGDYYFFIEFAASADGTAAQQSSGPYSFRIIKRDVTVTWAGSNTVVNPDGSVTIQIKYTGHLVKPLAEALDVNQDPLALTVKVTNPTNGNAQVVGSYTAKATLDNALDKKNYNLVNDVIDFDIIKSIGGNPDPDAGDGDIEGDPDDPLDPNNPFYEGISFMDPQLDPFNDDKPYTFGDEIFIQGSVKDKNGNVVDFVFKIDPDSGEVTEILYKDGTVYDPTPNCNFVVVWPDKFTCPESTIELHLKDPINTAWDNSGDSSNKPLVVKIDPQVLDPTDTGPDGTPVIIVYDNYTNTHQYTGEEITFPITVAVTQGTADTTDDIILVLDTHYKVIWLDNVNLSGDTVDTMASFVVVGIDAGGYSFKIGDETTPEKSDDAGRFTIYTPEPQRLKLNPDVNNSVKFMQITQDFTANTVVFTDMSNDARNAYLDGLNGATQTDNFIRLGGLYQGMSVESVMKRFVNNSNYLHIYPYDIDAGAPSPTEIAKTDYATTIITTGMLIELQNEMGNTIDTIELVLMGDTNGDGAINVLDSTNVLINALSVPSWTDLEKQNCLVQAGLIVKSGSTPNVLDSTQILQHGVNIVDINQDYIPIS